MVFKSVEILFVLLSIFILLLVYLITRSILVKHRKALITRDEAGQTEKKNDLGFVVDTFHDLVRELKDKEQELQRLRSIAEDRADSIESYNENILRSVASGVITFDREGKIMTFNPAAEIILSKRSEDAIGNICEDVFGKDNPITKIQMESLERAEGIARMETTVEKSYGEKIWLGLNTSLLKDNNGRLIGLILVFSDLTEIKHLQAQMELKERFALLGEMSAGIAHELRNPMGAIAGFSKLLSKKLDNGDERKPIADAIGF